MQQLSQILTEKNASSREVGYILHAVSCSAYLERLVTKSDDFITDLLDNIYKTYDIDAIKNHFFVENNCSEVSFFQQMRQMRQKIMAHLIVRDLNGLADYAEVVATTSALAEFALQSSIDYFTPQLTSSYGIPRSADGQPQSLIVVGMGKLGGAELNVSSDIDLIFAYEQEGETTGAHDGAKVISNQDFFTRLGKKVIAALDEVTADGFVFRVDMRLRPFGSEGALVSSLDSLEDYYQTYGREWERYAWIKGRVVAGPAEALHKALKPFVFRKYLDFNAYASMRDLKQQIQRDVMQRGMQNNIKLGRGGIREIEFIAQVFQLIRGGQEPDLQIKPTLQVLDRLAEKAWLPANDVLALKQSYVYLRNLEHRLMYIDDQQTQELPTSESSQQRLLAMLGLPNWETFLAQLNEHRERVQTYFDDTFKDEQQAPLAEETAVWQGTVSQSQALASLNAWGFQSAEDILQMLQMSRNSQKIQHLPEQSKRRFDQLMPMVIKQSAQQPLSVLADDALKRSLSLLENICRRASYLALLTEFPDALALVVRLCGASPWLAQYLTAHPILLDELLNQETLLKRLPVAQLKQELTQKVALLAGDVEAQMDALRHFKHANVLKIAAQDLMAALPLEAVSDDLSALAEMILQVSVDLVWQQLSIKHQDQPNFAVIGYGKLGGKELGYLSDLDIIFLYDDAHENAQEIYARFAQRLNHWFNTLTNAGLLYETDLQLRPDGNSGLLVSSVQAFAEYQQHKAWVWEHQALSRARFVAGDASIGEAFERIRLDTLKLVRDPQTLKQAVLEMREKMRASHRPKVGQFDIKQDIGGIIDVEFMVQYWVLLGSHAHASLTQNSGNISLLSTLASLGYLHVQQAEALSLAYRTYRSLLHTCKLQGQDAKVAQSSVTQHVESVKQAWQTLFG